MIHYSLSVAFIYRTVGKKQADSGKQDLFFFNIASGVFAHLLVFSRENAMFIEP